MIDGVSQVSMHVSVGGQDRAKAFWTEIIGFELLDDQAMGNERWIRITPPDRSVVLILGGPEFPQPPVSMFFGWWALFCDPDGNRFALNQRGQ